MKCPGGRETPLTRQIHFPGENPAALKDPNGKINTLRSQRTLLKEARGCLTEEGLARGCPRAEASGQDSTQPRDAQSVLALPFVFLNPHSSLG